MLVAASSCARAWTAACSSSPTAPASLRSPRPPPTSSSGPVAHPVRTVARAAAPLSAPGLRGAATSPPPQNALLRLARAWPHLLARRTPRTRGATAPPTHPDPGDDIFTEQLT